KHNLPCKGNSPWLKGFVGGSDDHSGINPGRTWTVFEYEGANATANGLIDSIRMRQTRPGGAHGGPITLAHSLLNLLYGGSHKRSNASGNASLSIEGPIQSLLELIFESEPPTFTRKLWRMKAYLGGVLTKWLRSGREKGLGAPFERILEREV